MTCLYQKSDMAHQVLPLLRLLLLLPWTACSLRKLKLSKIKYLQLNGQWTWKVNWQLRNWIQEGRKPWNLLELSWALDLKSSRAENLISGLRRKIKKKKEKKKREERTKRLDHQWAFLWKSCSCFIYIIESTGLVISFFCLFFHLFSFFPL